MTFSTLTLRPARRATLRSGDESRQEEAGAAERRRRARATRVPAHVPAPRGDAGSAARPAAGSEPAPGCGTLTPPRAPPAATGPARRTRSLRPELGRGGRSSGDTAVPFPPNQARPDGRTPCRGSPPAAGRAAGLAHDGFGLRAAPGPHWGTTRVDLHQHIHQPRPRSATPAVPAAADVTAAGAAARLSPLRARPHCRTPAAAAAARAAGACPERCPRPRGTRLALPGLRVGGHAGPGPAPTVTAYGLSRSPSSASPGPCPRCSCRAPGAAPRERRAETRGLRGQPRPKHLLREPASEWQPAPDRERVLPQVPAPDPPLGPEAAAGPRRGPAALSCPPIARDRQPGKAAPRAGASRAAPCRHRAGDRGELCGFTDCSLNGVHIWIRRNLYNVYHFKTIHLKHHSSCLECAVALATFCSF